MRKVLLPFIQLRFADQRAIGHDIGDYLNWVITARRQRRRILLIIYSRKHLSNRYVLDFWKHFALPGDNLITIKVPQALLAFFKRHAFFNRFRLVRHSGVSGTYDEKSHLDQNFPKYIPKLDVEWQNLLRELRNNKRNAYVLIMQRSPDFHSADSARDTPIKEFLPAIEYLITQGYTVVRYGRPTKDSLNYHHPNYIDLTRMRLADPDQLTFSVIPNCSFAISSWYGPMELLRYYQTPTLFVNVPPSFRELPRRMEATILFSKVFDLKTGESVNLNRLFQLINLGLNVRDSELLSRYGIKIVQLTSDELCSQIKVYETIINSGDAFSLKTSNEFRKELAKADSNKRRSFLNYENQLFGEQFLEIESNFLAILFPH